MAARLPLPDPSTWPPRLRALVYTQFVASNWAVPLANEIASGRASVQGIINAMAFLLSIDPLVPDSATTDPAYGVGRGIQLDRIGRIVGQPRGGAPDVEYRPLLRARIVANKSNGSPDAVINVFLAMFGGAGAPLYAPGWVAQFTLRLVGVIMDPLIANAAVGLLRAATQGGTRAVLEWTTVAPAFVTTCFAPTLASLASFVPTEAIGDPSFANVANGGRLGGAASI